jgi:hypothetical protein
VKRRTRTEVWIDLSARAVAAALKAHEKRSPGEFIVKKKLIPFVVERAQSLWDEDNNTLFDIEAIPAPTAKFITTRWSQICDYCANVLHTHIGWEPFQGVAIVGFEEWQNIPQDRLAPICQGVVDKVERMGRISQSQGGKAISIDLKVKQLTAGDGD